MTHAVGFVPRKSVADCRRVDRKFVVTCETVRVFVDGVGSKRAGLGVAVPD
jgi:hypothetical protein